MAYDSITSKIPHKRTKHGCKGRKIISPEYVSWVSMKNRCYCKTYIGYARYGGRGIKVCDRWLNSFENFLLDMGVKPSLLHSLDRFPNKDGDYEKSNCRWATRVQQNKNNSRNVWIEYNGNNHTASEWSEKIGITQAHLYWHLKRRSFKDVVSFFQKKAIKIKK